MTTSTVLPVEAVAPSRSDSRVAERRSKQLRRLSDPIAILLIFLATIVLSIPLLQYGPYPKGHDVYEHTYFGTNFSAQFWKGELYPRWLPDINAGLGSPSFYVFPPFEAYAFALLEPVVGRSGLSVLAVTEILALFLSGVCAFVWMRDQYSRPVAITVSILYLMIPYHLEIDTYWRAAMGECWAMTWIPLLLYCTNRIIRGRRAAILGFGVVYALLILSHLISVLMISAVPLALTVFLAARSQRRRAFLWVAAGMALGVALSAFYFLPALRNARYFPPGNLLPDLHEYLISRASLFGSSTADPFKHRVALCGALGAIGSVVCGAALLLRGSRRSARLTWFWLAVGIVPSLAMWSFTARIWKIAHPLLAAIQYQFRLNLLVALVETALIAALLADFNWSRGRAALVRVALLAVIVIPWVFSYGATWKAYLREGNPKAEFDQHQYSYHSDGWFLAWYKGSNVKSTFAASAGPRARFVDGIGTATVDRWEPGRIEIETDSPTGGAIMINQFYYPLWRARLRPSMAQVDSQPAQPEGLLTAHVPAGHAHLLFDIPAHRSEIFGMWISAVSLFITGLLTWRFQEPF
jgi:6-pyruvoyl-tetrahydropterin synthase related domain